jgi:hypothetical protein
MEQAMETRPEPEITVQAVEGEEGLYRHTATDPSDPRLRSFRQALSGMHWGYGVQLLELLELAIPFDRQFEKVRARVLKLLNSEEAALHNLAGRALSEDARDEFIDGQTVAISQTLTGVRQGDTSTITSGTPRRSRNAQAR